VNPHILGKSRLRPSRCTNDQRHRRPWEEHTHTVTYEGQIAVFEDPPGHTGILAGNWYVTPHMLGKPRLRTARCANDQRHRRLWGEYMVDTVTFEDQITVFEDPPGHTGILAENWYVNPRMLGKPRLRASRCANDQRHRSMWGEYMSDPVTVEGQNAVFRLPTSHTGLWWESNLLTHMCSESPGCEL